MDLWGTGVAHLIVLLIGNFMLAGKNMLDIVKQEHTLDALIHIVGKFLVGELDEQDLWGIKLDNTEMELIALILTVDVGLMVMILVDQCHLM
jgi:hypothetical protein